MAFKVLCESPSVPRAIKAVQDSRDIPKTIRAKVGIKKRKK